MTAWWLTWLWQGFALAAATGAAFRLRPRVNASTRYWIWWITAGVVGATGAIGATGAMGATGTESDATHLFLIPTAPDGFITLACGIWAAVALVGLVRVAAGVRAVFVLRDRCRPFPADLEAQLPLWLEARRHGREAHVMLCEAVDGAKMLGLGRACIALPPSLVTALTLEELDQIVLHEYAHVHRWDDWTRLAQAVLQSALWIHPAIALLGRRLHMEREVACDEWVVARTALPKAYARCLTRAAEVRGTATELMLGSALFGSTPQLVRRVDRLLALEGRVRPNVSALAAVAGACALVAIALALRSIPLVAEVGNVMFPEVTVRLKPDTTYDAPVTFVPVTVRLKPDTTYALNAPDVPDAPDAPLAPDAPIAPNAPLAPDTPILIARTFDGDYRPAGVAAPVNASRPWHVAEAAGIKIAQTFTRAGVSLARRF